MATHSTVITQVKQTVFPTALVSLSPWNLARVDQTLYRLLHIDMNEPITAMCTKHVITRQLVSPGQPRKEPIKTIVSVKMNVTMRCNFSLPNNVCCRLQHTSMRRVAAMKRMETLNPTIAGGTFINSRVGYSPVTLQVSCLIISDVSL